jgi:hypothetical protein
MIIALLVMALLGCSSNDSLRKAMNRIVPPDDEALAKECLSALIKGDYPTVKKQLDPQFVKPGIDSNLAQITHILAQEGPPSLELVGCNVFSTAEKRRSSLTYQYHFKNAWVLAAVTIDTEAENKRVFGINVNPIPKSLEELNAFTLKGKGAIHYVIFVTAIIVPVFIIWTIIICARTKIRRKWLWIIGILIGIGRINLNWTTGQLGFQLIAFQIPGAGIVKMGLYAPWILTVSIPVVAIWFLIKRQKIQGIVGTQIRNNSAGETPGEPIA